MRSKALNAFLLVIAVVMDATILFLVPGTWMRLLLGLALLAPIINLASHLELAEMFGDLPAITPRRRSFPLLRANVAALLNEVRRLNWLVVDLDRGLRDRDAVEAYMEVSERRLGELLEEIKRTAGQHAAEFDEGADTHPVEPPAMPVDEPPQGTDAD